MSCGLVLGGLIFVNLVPNDAYTVNFAQVESRGTSQITDLDEIRVTVLYTFVCLG